MPAKLVLDRLMVLSLLALPLAGPMVAGCGGGGGKSGGADGGFFVAVDSNPDSSRGAKPFDADLTTPTGESILFKMESVQGVGRNPPVPTVIVLTSSAYITRVMTYHYAETIGSKAPTVALQDTTTGKTYGPWAQQGYKSFNGTPGVPATDPSNVAGPPDNYWIAFPGQMLPAGTYQVVDSEPRTWCYTADLGNRGVTWVWGRLGDAPLQGHDGGTLPDAPSDSADAAKDGVAIIDGRLRDVSGSKPDGVAIDGSGKGDVPSGDGPLTVPNPALGGDESGLDLSGYSVRATLDAGGGTLSLAGGPSLSVAPGVLSDSVVIGMRPAAAPVSSGAPGYTLLTGWYDLATSKRTTMVAKDSIVIEIPGTPPAAALAHPGLQVLAMVNGVTLPLDGTYSSATGTFRVELLGLPASFSFALAFNPGIQTLTSDDLPAHHGEPTPTPWSTLDWWIVFDGQVVKMDGAKKILAWARAASAKYSAAGLKEPSLRKETVGTKPRWTIHLTTDGSYYEGAPADRGTFGRQYMSTDRVQSPMTDPLGSGQASVAHELFHAIFRSYHIPKRTVCDPADVCEATSAGINEGMATAAGYWIDQGSPAKPRPSEKARPVSLAFGYFQPDDSGSMYRNQDFYVYLLRIGTLDNFRMHLEALATASVPNNNFLLEALNSYGNALSASPTGFGGNFAQTWAWYAADRVYVRSADGWLWPKEPAGGTPGSAYVLDPSLLDSWAKIDVSNDDCVLGTNVLTCQVTLAVRSAMDTTVVSADLSSLTLPAAMVGQALKGTFSAQAEKGTVAFSAFGEKLGKGNAAAALRSPTGTAVSLDKIGTDLTTVRLVVVPAGSDMQNVTVQMSFAMPQALKWSALSMDSMTWQNAKTYCAGLGGRLPTISELQTLITGCAQSQTGGQCTVTDTCLSTTECPNSACKGCAGSTSGKYSTLGDSQWLWTGSVASDNSSYSWSVRFEYGRVDYDSAIFTHFVRCLL